MSYFKKGKPFIIAGPCSAETQTQILETAEALASLNIDLFRAGIWKPRTRPGAFEGNGVLALEWLAEVKSRYNLPVTIEVAETNHIEEALMNNIDVIWIGARTTVNPFQVQQLADALQGVSIPVMIKNPVNPDVDLWLGAIERFEKAGITNIAAIHRGFSSYNKQSGYRNQPNWTLPIELKRRRPELPIFCDPSHITGNRDMVAEVAQKAMDMRFDGLMIETHPRPEEAWTDAAQQITPYQLQELLTHLIIRQEFTEDMNSHTKLENLRLIMDSFDAEIIDIIARRMELSEEIGKVKKECNMTIYQPARWQEMLKTREERALKNNLHKDFIIELFEKLHNESIRIQLSVLESVLNEIKK